MSKPYHASRDNVRHKYVMSREPRRKCIIVGFFAAMMYGDWTGDELVSEQIVTWSSLLGQHDNHYELHVLIAHLVFEI